MRKSSRTSLTSLFDGPMRDRHADPILMAHLASKYKHLSRGFLLASAAAGQRVVTCNNCNKSFLDQRRTCRCDICRRSAYSSSHRGYADKNEYLSIYKSRETKFPSLLEMRVWVPHKCGTLEMIPWYEKTSFANRGFVWRATERLQSDWVLQIKLSSENFKDPTVMLFKISAQNYVHV